MLMPWVPRIARHFRFFEPITAPIAGTTGRLASAVDHTGVAHHLLSARTNPEILDLVVA